MKKEGIQRGKKSEERKKKSGSKTEKWWNLRKNHILRGKARKHRGKNNSGEK